MTQINRIEKHLKKRSITSIQAYDSYGVTRLSSIIHDLRCRGNNIIGTPINVKNRYGDKCRVFRYSLAKAK